MQQLMASLKVLSTVVNLSLPGISNVKTCVRTVGNSRPRYMKTSRYVLTNVLKFCRNNKIKTSKNTLFRNTEYIGRSDFKYRLDNSNIGASETKATKTRCSNYHYKWQHRYTHTLLFSNCTVLFQLSLKIWSLKSKWKRVRYYTIVSSVHSCIRFSMVQHRNV